MIPFPRRLFYFQDPCAVTDLAWFPAEFEDFLFENLSCTFTLRARNLLCFTHKNSFSQHLKQYTLRWLCTCLETTWSPSSISLPQLETLHVRTLSPIKRLIVRSLITYAFDFNLSTPHHAFFHVQKRNGGFLSSLEFHD